MSWGDIGTWFKSGDNLSGLGSLIGGLGGLYGGYQQSKYSKDLLKLQKADYYRGIEREDEADRTLANAYANSAYGKPLVKLD